MHQLAIDGGTTNTRVRVLQDNRLLSETRCHSGARDVAQGQDRTQLIANLSKAISQALGSAALRPQQIELAVISGMLTSNVGLYEVAHVQAPADLDSLARNAVQVQFPELLRLPFFLIPGVKQFQVGAETNWDMMRGEESEVFGILMDHRPTLPAVIILPGSHTKWIELDGQNRISQIQTSLAGELLSALANHTILAGSVAWPPTGLPDQDQVKRGFEIVQEAGLLRAGFNVRIQQLLAGKSHLDCAWLLCGMVIGSDVLTQTTRDFPGQHRLVLGGTEPLRSIYAQLYSLRGVPVETVDSEAAGLAAARGAVHIAKRAREIIDRNQ